ncbi:MAG: hypothetical protein AAGF53_06820 [Pseudomonadota bacterium]
MSKNQQNSESGSFLDKHYEAAPVRSWIIAFGLIVVPCMSFLIYEFVY